MNKTIYMAPTPSAHKVTDPACIYIRRPAEYTKGKRSAHAIKIEAYVPGHPRDDFGVEEWKGSTLSDPIFCRLVWVTSDHRARWDETTEGRTGTKLNHELSELYDIVSTDAPALWRAINEALSAIEACTPEEPVDLDDLA